MTYSKLDGDGEELNASSLGDGLTSGNTRQVDVAGLNKALLTLDSAEQLLGESEDFMLAFAPWMEGNSAKGDLTGNQHKP